MRRTIAEINPPTIVTENKCRHTKATRSLVTWAFNMAVGLVIVLFVVYYRLVSADIAKLVAATLLIQLSSLVAI
jgi:hypothetical protein